MCTSAICHSSTTMMVNVVRQWTQPRLFSTYKIINCYFHLSKVYIGYHDPKTVPNQRNLMCPAYTFNVISFALLILHCTRFSFYISLKTSQQHKEYFRHFSSTVTPLLLSVLWRTTSALYVCFFLNRKLITLYNIYVPHEMAHVCVCIVLIYVVAHRTQNEFWLFEIE